MSRIAFRGIGKRYGAVEVIRDLDLEVREHEFMVLVGPSGCGKTTALRMIAGLEEVSAGTLEIDGRVVNDVPPKDRDIAMVFQSYALYPHMSVRDNLAFGLTLRRMPPAEIARLVDEAAALLGLSALLERKPKALSGGQRQRVALGRALVRKPSVFLFDEPLSNLDADLRVLMRAELAKLQQRLGTTTVYVTHDQVEAMTLGHRIAVLAPLGAGHALNLQQVGPPLELYHRPANVFVARFLGTPAMNLVRARVREDLGLEGEGFRLPPPPAATALLAPRRGGELLLGIRPEDVREAGAGTGAARAPFVTGPAEIIETVGHEVIVHVRVGGERVIAKLGAERIPVFGEAVALALDPAALHLFDAATGLRLAAPSSV